VLSTEWCSAIRAGLIDEAQLIVAELIDHNCENELWSLWQLFVCGD
jgi:hypothetical protein